MTSGFKRRQSTSLLALPVRHLIYSPSLDALPAPAKAKANFYGRAKRILSSGDTANFSHLSVEDWKAIFEISSIRNRTLPEWRNSSGQALSSPSNLLSEKGEAVLYERPLTSFECRSAPHWRYRYSGSRRPGLVLIGVIEVGAARRARVGPRDSGDEAQREFELVRRF